MADLGIDLQDSAAAGLGARPRVTRVHHISVPVRDLDEAREFWVRAFGAEPVSTRRPRFAAVRVADVTVGLAEQDGGWTARGAEYPHCGFRFAPDAMWSAQARLQALGVPTGRIWTRHGVEGLMYFRDPSGNLFETACWHGLADADALPRDVRGGGSYRIDLEGLNYTWKPPAAGAADGQAVRPTQLDHLSLPVRDMPQTARFWVDVLGATPGRQPNHMVEIAGIDISFNAQPTGWTRRDAEFPHYAFAIAPEHLLPMKARLAAFGIPTHPICTDDDGAAFLYFRDPAGNLFQLHCARGLPTGAAIPRDAVAGADSHVDLAALNYDWTG
ncbi:MAG TPA: VOC family protein [Chloroflexota bacterium]|nr:VOC family protein [Chloroflexota bacterium]